MNLIKNFLITGPPGVGKTTLIKHIADNLKDLNPVGFYTQEIRELGVRKGFELVSFDGVRGILSHTDIDSNFRVGKYRVDFNAFENFLDRIPFHEASRSLVVIDEIGKMELISRKFIKIVEELLDSDRPVIATIALRGGGFVDRVKKRPDTELFILNRRGDRDKLSSTLAEKIERIISERD